MVAKVKVSLIIPVYNKGKYIKRCLDSISTQFRPGFEVIIVDDGSTDNSVEQCLQYVDKYHWKLSVLSHRGVSEARNYGMEHAKGDYIAFLDADDALAPGALESMLKMARKGYNIVQFGQWRCKDYNELNLKMRLPYRAPEGAYGFDYIPKYWVMVWNKLYKRSFIEEAGLEFMKGMQFGEDAVFNMEGILANRGLYYAPYSTVIHCIDDKESLCRGNLKRSQLVLLDEEMTKIAKKQTEPEKIHWCETAINEHRFSKLFGRLGAGRGRKGEFDVVYMVKESPSNEELIYSLRSLEENWSYNRVWFCGGCPEGLKPDKMFKLKQEGLDKWWKVRNMIRKVCENDEITEDFWLFNDDFFILKPMAQDFQPQYNGDLMGYILRTERRLGGPDGFTVRLREANNALLRFGCGTLNYEVHKPMLINRKKALEVLDKFGDVPAFRSLYGNYHKIGGVDRHDMKVKILNYPNMYNVENFWDFVSTSDESFRDGEVGRFLRDKFNKKSRFERS